MRKGFEGLYGLVRDRLLCEPLSGPLFLLGRNRTLGVRETITERVLQALASVPPGSAAERAASICFRISSNSGRDCNYTLTLWQKLTRFLEHPELELSNNL